MLNNKNNKENMLNNSNNTKKILFNIIPQQIRILRIYMDSLLYVVGSGIQYCCDLCIPIYKSDTGKVEPDLTGHVFQLENTVYKILELIPYSPTQLCSPNYPPCPTHGEQHLEIKVIKCKP